MNLYELFRELMDQIYFSGYTDEVLSQDQELFNFEWKNFLSCYA